MVKTIFVAMQPNEFRRHGHAVVDWIADYLENPEQWPVLPGVQPGELRNSLPQSPPARGESMDAVLDDFRKLIVPATTHWNHPAFMAYFANSSTGAGVLGEALTAALNVNAMLWRTSPAATELELLTLDWLRQMLGLPEKFFGVIGDTASSNTLYALAAAREMHPELRIRQDGMSGRADMPNVVVYCSEEAHSSVDKAVMTLGFGLSSLRKIPTDDQMRMDAGALAAAVEDDRRAGSIPLAVVATVGTTSTTAIDPVPAIASICERERMWLHIDASYGGTAAILPELRFVLEGCDRADSLVVNPHKWMFTPMDCSVLYTSRPDLLKRAFQHIPEFLVVSEGEKVVNLMDYGIALGRRFRALKLWFVIRNFGVEGLQSRIREHIRLAKLLAQWIDDDPIFERLAEVRFSTVVFRHVSPGMTADQLNDHNARVLETVNATREVYLSHTKVRGRYAFRLAIGNIHTAEAHVRRAFDLVREAGRLK
ncbi:MAG: aromatic-L-amino-acid/L-tryptophan decarboxylase [Gemmatimonadaceae bacterium]|jgi:aromatic-L-amino-acid decarboxylase|nr:aromatic-L-amino-acid/L-tryptophan decarboxylase [Gemmatimonadaceae bacterium]